MYVYSQNILFLLLIQVIKIDLKKANSFCYYFNNSIVS